MNMGAILRTAAFLGVDKVVSSEYDRYTSCFQEVVVFVLCNIYTGLLSQ